MRGGDAQHSVLPSGASARRHRCNSAKPALCRALAMAPGTTRTEMVAAAYTEERFAEIAQSTPLRYAVEHDELARLAVFLTSDLARAITGQMILADAGAFLSRTRPPNQRPEF